MTTHHPDLAGQVDQVALRFFPAQAQAEEVGMEAAVAELPEAWASWEAPEGQAAASPDGGHRSALRPTLDLTTSLALEECLASEVVVGEAAAEEAEAVDSPLVALLSSICHQTSALPCTRGQVSIPCCLQGAWEALEEGGHPTLGLACLHSSSTDRVDTRSTAHPCLVAEALEGPLMAHSLPWEEAWVLG